MMESELDAKRHIYHMITQPLQVPAGEEPN